MELSMLVFKAVKTSDLILMELLGRRLSSEMEAFLILLKYDKHVRWLSSGHHPDDVGSKHRWNIGKILPGYTAQQPRRQPSS
jgi:hypothetical protein